MSGAADPQAMLDGIKESEMVASMAAKLRGMDNGPSGTGMDR